MNVKRNGWSRSSDRGIEFLKLLKCYIFQENYVAIISPQKKSWNRNIALYQTSENQGELSQKSLWEWASLVLLLKSTHFLYYSVTKRYAYLGYFHVSAQYQAFILSKFLIQLCILVSLQN